MMSKFRNVFSFCKSLNGNATGIYIYFFSEQKFKCQCCEFVCTDGAATLTGRLSDFVPWLKKKANSSINSSRLSPVGML